MKKCFTLTFLALLACSTYGANSDYLLPNGMAMSPAGDTLAISEFGAKQIALTDLKGVPTRTIKLTYASGGFLGLFKEGADYPALSVTYSKDGKTIYATAENGNNGMLFAIDVQSGEIRESVITGNHPVGVIVSSDGQSVYICNRFDNTVQRYDAKSLKLMAEGKVLREPIGCILGVGDQLLLVANHLPNEVTEPVGITASSVSVLDAKTLEKKFDATLPNGSTGVRGIAATADGASIYITHTIARYQLPTTQLERGWMNTSAMSVFDGKTGMHINTILLDDVDLGAANPWAITLTPDNTSIIVTHAGTNEVSVIDRTKLHKQLEMAAANVKVNEVTSSAADVPNDLSFLSGIRRRISFPANGPRSVVATNDRVYTAAYFVDALIEIPFKNRVVRPIVYPLADKLIDLSKDRVLRGEMLFNDAAMCFQQWQSCATCHPDGRADALNWDLLNDGIGNPKQTKNMLLSDLTPPTMITGIRKDMQHCNRAGIRHIQFCSRPEEDPLCIDMYIMSMRAQPSPYTRDTGAVARGKALFVQAGCADCHSGDLYTDLKQYDMGLGTRNEVGRKFDTPTLRESWRTAPYLYDGRALTMEDVLTTFNPNDTHGVTSDLTKEEISDLSTFVRSL